MTQEALIETPPVESAEAPSEPTLTLRDQYVAEERARLEPEAVTPETPEAVEGETPAVEESPAAEATPELAPLDLERFPALAETEAGLSVEARTQLREFLADQAATVHNSYADFNDQIGQRADDVIAQVDAAQAVVGQLASAVQQGLAAGNFTIADLRSLVEDPANKEALTALAPHVIAAGVDKALKEERGQIQAESFNQGVVFALYEPVKALKIPNLTKQVTDLLRETKGDEKQNVPSQIIGAVHEAGIKEGIRRGESAFGREKSIANNGDAGPAALAGGVAPGKTDREKLLDPNTPLDELRAIRERQRRAS